MREGIAQDRSDNEQSTLVDAVTGRTIVDLGRQGEVPLTDSEDTDPVWVLRPSREPPGRMVAGQIADRTSGLTRPGLIDPVGRFSCQAAGTRPACTTDFRLTVTDLGPRVTPRPPTLR